MAHSNLPREPAQPDVFLGRLPRTLRCTKPSGVFAHGLEIRRTGTALGRPHIQVNAPWARSFLVFDVDRPDAERRWRDAGLPPPWWNSINPANGHGHTCWALDAPVLLGDHDRQHPMRYLCAVESALRERIGGDPSYGGLVTKNPTHSRWRTLRGGRPMTLGELAAHLPDLNKHAARRPVRKADLTGVGRNCDTFDVVRVYAYRAVRGFWGERGGFVHFQADLHRKAMDYTGQEHRTPLDHRECHHLARSVAQWTWGRFTPKTWAARQAALGRRSGASRRDANAERDAEIARLARDGLSQRKLAAMFGLSRGGVVRVLGRGVDPEPYQDAYHPLVIRDPSSAAKLKAKPSSPPQSGLLGDDVEARTDRKPSASGSRRRRRVETDRERLKRRARERGYDRLPIALLTHAHAAGTLWRLWDVGRGCGVWEKVGVECSPDDPDGVEMCGDWWRPIWARRADPALVALGGKHP